MRCTTKPVSVVELSDQLSWMLVADCTVALNPLGAAGTAFVVAVATFDADELPTAFTAKTRYEYCVSACTVVSVNDVTPEAVVVTVAQELPPVARRCTTNPVSFAELSAQVSKMLVDDCTVALNPLGAAGAEFVVAVATLDSDELPTPFTA
jgi:hypothetical protein